MLSIELIRQDPERVRHALQARGETDPLGELLELDAQRRQDITDGDDLRGRRNRVSRDLGRARASGQEPSSEIVQEMRQVGDDISRLEARVRDTEERINTILMGLPNLPLPEVPPGEGEEDNKEVRRWGDIPSFDFTPLPHWELGEQLGVIDFQRGVKLSGSRFYTMFGAGAKLERSLIAWMLDLHTTEHGYTEVMLPLIVKRETMEGSGNLPKFGDNLYHDEEDDLWLIPTAEVPITNLHRDEVLSAEILPRSYVAYTPCFRREKAAAGRDTRGIKRVHQFDKVEMYKLVEPESSPAELEKLVADAEDVCRRLGLAYRVLQLCTGDLGFASAMTYDIELGPPAVKNGWRSAPVPTAPIFKPAGPTSGTAPTRTPGRCRSIRLTARDWHCQGWSSPSWRTTSKPTARWLSRTCCGRTPASTAFRPSPPAN